MKFLFSNESNAVEMGTVKTAGYFDKEIGDISVMISCTQCHMYM